MNNITKSFPGVRALENVSLHVHAGEVHCLVGENGAGKSTLMNILSGAIPKDTGSIALEGKPVNIRTPLDAKAYGIGMIYQDVKLVPDMTVMENIFLGREMKGRFFGLLQHDAMRRKTIDLLDSVGERISPDAVIRELSIAQKQMIEIVKAVSRKLRILVLDEPTAALTAKEKERLFSLIRNLKRDGVGIIYISHRLEEIFEIGDSITVLRDGRHVDTKPASELQKRDLIRMMVGRELENEYPKTGTHSRESIFRFRNVQTKRLCDINLEVKAGEILGIAGLAGSGQRDLANLMFGEEALLGGQMIYQGRGYRPDSPRQAIRSGVALLTEDRNLYGLFLDMSITENISISSMSRFAPRVLIKAEYEEKNTRDYISALSIKPAVPSAPVQSLSGGNRQKVILARWLTTQSQIFIFNEPTAGVDVGAKYEMYLEIDKLAANGKGVLFISSDMLELLGMCDRIAVMFQGEIRGVLLREEATQEAIMALAVGESIKVKTP